MILYPAWNLAVVVLSNTSTQPAAMMEDFTIAPEAVAAVLPDKAPSRLVTPPGPPGPPSLL
jgi:hypothetical protein